MQPPGVAPPPNHLVWAILTTVFCCLPLGIVSIVYAAQVGTKHQAGDLAGAQDASGKAKAWALVSAGVGIATVVLTFIAVAIMGVAIFESGEFAP